MVSKRTEDFMRRDVKYFDAPYSCSGKKAKGGTRKGPWNMVTGHRG